MAETPKSMHRQLLLNSASFNQDNSCFSTCGMDGYKIYNCEGGNLCYQKTEGAINIVEMLFSSSLLVIVGAGEQPALSPRRLCLFNTATGASKQLNFVTSILAVRLNRKRLIVVLQESMYIYDLNDLIILYSIDTVPNPKGLCAFSPKEDNCYLALPASTDKGVVLIYNVNELHSHCQINAHRSPLVAMALSSDGTYLATASEQGTVIRVYLVSQPSETFTFRRGTYPATIYSLSFGPPSQVPRLLVATSSSGSVHIFTLGLMTTESNKRSGFLATVMPTSINDAFEASYHHVVLHNVLPVRVKSIATIWSVEEVSMKGVAMTSHVLRARILTVAYNGYFNEYSIVLDSNNKYSWNLERVCNLLASPSEQISATFV